MHARISLYFHPDVYDIKGTERLFDRAMRCNFRFHLRHNPSYRQIAARFGQKGIPPLPTALFKREALWTLPERRMAVKASSSGTSGMQSRIGYDWESLFLAAVMTLKLGRRHRLFSPVPTRYVMLGYEPHRGNSAIITKTQGITSLFAPPAGRLYALRWKDGGYQLNLKELEARLHRWAKGRLPVRLIGFPSYLYFFLLRLKRSRQSYRLPPGSMVLMGGGWKEFSKSRVEKETLTALIREVLGIEPSQVREFFGAAEHPVFYCTCPHHHFHVPVYGRVIIRHVQTLKPLGYGKPGILNLLSPLARSMPLLSVMTDDLAVLHPGKDCGCGIESPYFEILGRAGLEEIRTCAAEAGKLLKKQPCETETV